MAKPREEEGESPDGEEDEGPWFQNAQQLLTALWLFWGDSKTSQAAWAPRKVEPETSDTLLNRHGPAPHAGQEETVFIHQVGGEDLKVGIKLILRKNFKWLCFLHSHVYGLKSSPTTF